MKGLPLSSRILGQDNWSYLGDNVSARLQDGTIHLNENKNSPVGGWLYSHTIVLTPATLKAFLLYLESLNVPQSEDGKWFGLRIWMKKLRSSGSKA
jgi:hypothetical protein